ncbi:MAG: TIGR02266 family protein [Myxococcales bacterium]|jgi:uncharacterized protein (TIGR02266 family)
MLGLKLVANEAAVTFDEQMLAEEEEALRSVEARLVARDIEIARQDEAIRGAQEKLRGQLEACSRSLPGLPALGPARAPRPLCREACELPEVTRALADRRRALAARHEAIKARERQLALRERALAQAQAELSGLEQALREAEAMLEEARRAEAEARLEGARRAEAEARRKQEENARSRARSIEAPPVAPAHERRLSPRARLQTEVTLGSDSNLFTGFSSDISRGGIFVATCQIMPLGTRVEVGLELPEGTRIEVRGVVRWSREPNDRFPEVFPGVGIQFTELEEESRRALEAFAARREPLFFPD